jgi:hypothetical protein
MMNIEELQLSVRSFNALKRAHIDTVEQLKQMSAYEISRIRNIGKTCVDEILVKLSYIAKTNADHIRSMSDEELADFFILRDAMRRLYIESEVYSCYSQSNLINNSESLTKTTWLNWLKQPYKE